MKAFCRKISLEIASLMVSTFLLAGGVFAQEAADSSNGLLKPPAGSMIASAPELSQWVITFSYPGDTPKGVTPPPPLPADNRLRAITTTKTKEIVHEQAVNGMGRTIDTWVIGQDQFFKASDDTFWGRALPGHSVWPANGFRDLDWVSRDNYVGTMKYAGHSCLVFIQGAPVGMNIAKPGAPVPSFDSFNVVAFIDAESRLPVESRDVGVVRSFQFGPEPTDKLVPPPDLAQELKHAALLNATFSQRPTREY
jgi:hypothetical protein